MFWRCSNESSFNHMGNMIEVTALDEKIRNEKKCTLSSVNVATLNFICPRPV